MVSVFWTWNKQLKKNLSWSQRRRYNSPVNTSHRMYNSNPTSLSNINQNEKDSLMVVILCVLSILVFERNPTEINCFAQIHTEFTVAWLPCCVELYLTTCSILDNGIKGQTKQRVASVALEEHS